MNENLPNHHRDNARKAVRRDFARHAGREADDRTFWRSLGVLGMVGWPIALATVGGALGGRYLDNRFGTGVQFTLMLVTAGALIGSYTAWQPVSGR